MTTTTTPAIPDATATKIEDNAQSIINTAETLVPAKDVSAFKAWFKKYLKGIIATVGTVATLALTVIPPSSAVYHYAAIIVGAVTIIGVIEARNGI